MASIPIYVLASFIALFYFLGLSFFAAIAVFVIGIFANLYIG
jgi:hypothetical protein